MVPTVPSFCPAVTVSPGFTAGLFTPHTRHRRPEASSSVTTLLHRPSVPVSVTYAVTPLGLTLVQALQPMIDWAETRMPEVALAQAGYDAAQIR